MLKQRAIYIILAIAVTSLVAGPLQAAATGNNSSNGGSLGTEADFSQSNHYNTLKGFMNDIQTIFRGEDGYYHMYYLLNKNYKSANDGTEWYHVRTKDWERFEDLGVAIPKFVHGWSAVASGSIYQNHNGFFKDLPRKAIVAYFTSYTETGQHQYVAYSLDDGRSYRPYNSGQPVMKAHSKEQNFRDPYIWYNQQNNRLMMYLAEGDKVGTYSSTDGKKWQYQGATILNNHSLGGRDLGLVECPNLKTLYDPWTKTTKQVLLFGANGYQYGSTTGSYYMIGHLDRAGNFVAEQQPQRLDQGSDYYAANYYQASKTTLKSIGWMGNWEYSQGKILNSAGQEAKHIGSISSTRDVVMVRQNGQYMLQSRLNNSDRRTDGKRYFSSARHTKLAADGYHRELLNVRRNSSQNMTLRFAGNNNKLTGHIRLFIKQKDSQVSLDLNADNGIYEVKRHSSKIVGDAKQRYEKPYVVRSNWRQQYKRFTLRVVADKSSLEITSPNGQVYSMVKLSTDPNMQVVVETSGDNRLMARLDNLSQ